MPNTKSAKRRMRRSGRREVINKSSKSRVKTLELAFLASVTAGNKEAAGKALRTISSALDKAAKTGIVHSGTASRKKSRLTTRFNAIA